MLDIATPLEFERQLLMTKAVMAAEIADNCQLPIAHPTLLNNGGDNLLQKNYLTLLDCHVVGYPLGDELMPLAYMLNKLPRPQIDPEVGITHYDELMDDANAHLHDRLLNVTLPFDVKSEINFDSEPLNKIYEDFLVHSDFAGGISTQSAEKNAAMALLFPNNEDGIPTESAIYKTYVRLTGAVAQLTLDVKTHRNAGDTAQKEIAETNLLQKKAELELIGQRRRIEKALKLLSTSDDSVGFEDEREDYRNLFEARRRERLSEGLSYHTAKIRPLEPLFDFGSSALWRTVSLDKKAIKARLAPRIQSYFNFTESEVRAFLDVSPHVIFDYVACDLTREWWSRDFLTARYWNNSETLSNGSGGGKIPTEPRKLIFIRSTTVKTQDSVSIIQANIKKIGNIAPVVRKMDFSQKRTAPLLKEMKVMRMEPSVKANLMKMDIQKLVKPQAVQINAVGANRFKALNSKAMLKPRPAPVRPKVKAQIQPNTKVKLDAPFAKVGTLKHIKAAKLEPHVMKLDVAKVFPGFFQKKPVTRPTKVDKAAVINGKLRIEGNIDINNVIVTLHEMEGRSLRQTRISLMDKSKNQYWFNAHAFRLIKIKRKGKTPLKFNAIAFKIEVTYKGQTVIDQFFEYADKTSTHNLDWIMKPNITEYQLADTQQPNLFGYGIRLLPKTPDPDPDLDWDGEIFT